MGDFKYKAFISYSHKDRKWTRWLHRRLETYPIPKNIIGNVTSAGTIPKRLKPIFRDREELSASNNLGEKIEAALASSKNLIIICSPAAAKSKWVNQEILTFKQNNRDAQLFSVIVEGEPYASTMPGREDEECFPPALRFEVNEDGTLSDTPAEPLAADLRPHADGKRLGFLKLISGMIGVGLDDVVQRDMKRSRKRVTAITTGSLATVLAMGTLTGFALDARSEAEQRRNDAEGQIEFMLTDLKEKLEGVGRLDALKIVGDRAESYYKKYPLAKHDDDAQGRRARVSLYLGEIQINLGNVSEANEYIKLAYQLTQVLYNRSSDNANRTYDHAQSTFWMGYVQYVNRNIAVAEKYFSEYLLLTDQLVGIDSKNSKFKYERSNALTNLAIIEAEKLNVDTARAYYEASLPGFKIYLSAHKGQKQAYLDLANAYAWLADWHMHYGQLKTALNYRVEQIRTQNLILEKAPNDVELKSENLRGVLAKSDLLYLIGDSKLANILVLDVIEKAERLHRIDQDNQASTELLILALTRKAQMELTQENFLNSKKYIEVIDEYLSLLNSKGKDQLSQFRKESVVTPALLLKADWAYQNTHFDASRKFLETVNNYGALSPSASLQHQVNFVKYNYILGLNYLLSGNREGADEQFRQNDIDDVRVSHITISTIARTYKRQNRHEEADELIETLEKNGFSTTFIN